MRRGSRARGWLLVGAAYAADQQSSVLVFVAVLRALAAIVLDRDGETALRRAASDAQEG